MEEAGSFKNLRLPLVAIGKVRELYDLSPEKLLFVATDKISAFDVVLSNGVPDKGKLLTQLSAHWFEVLKEKIPELKTHFVSTEIPSDVQLSKNGDPADEESLRKQLEGRSMIVNKFKILPLESIVRGYITGSAWAEYKRTGTVHEVDMPAHLQESQRLEKSIWTPSTKAEAGEHDENISPQQAAEIVGADIALRVESMSLRIYEVARAYAEERGIIIADTKFEFGVIDHEDDEASSINNGNSNGEEGNNNSNGSGGKKRGFEIVLVDEVLTPDSSRFWDAKKYEVGRAQDSLDKQPLRDWLTSENLKGKPGVGMTEEILERTSKGYVEAFEALTGREWVAS